jgi:hypothetical protein
MRDDLQFETRFSKSRGLFPYVLGLIGLAVVIVLFMIVTGIGRDRLPFAEYFAVHAPTAADGSEALSLQTLMQIETEKTLTIDGTVANRTDKVISGLVAVIVVNDRFTLPSQTVNVPLEPADLAPKGTATFHTMITLDEKGLGGYNVQFRLPNEGPFVPHRDERPPEEPKEPSENKPTK